jgi:cyclase
VDLGNREVQLRHLGRGNTRGDIVVVLPREKIAIAGDLLDHPVPYLGGGYPSELVKTLENLARLEVETIVPGHGEILKGKEYLNEVTHFVRVVVAAVNKAVYKTGSGAQNLEEVRAQVLKDVDIAAFRKQFAGDDKENQEFFDGFSLKGLITAAFAETWGK